MITRKIIFVLLLLLLTDCAVYAQQKKTFNESVTEARAMLDNGKYDTAIKILETCKKRKPEEHVSWQLTGIAYYKKGRYDKALAQLENAKKLFADDFVSETYIGFILLKKGSAAKAMSFFKAANKKAPEYPLALIGMGHVFIKQKDLGKGRKYMRQAIEACLDDDVTVYTTIADIYIQEKKPDDAIFTYKKYISECGETSPRNTAYINFLLGKIYEIKNNKMAEGAYKSAVEHDGTNFRYKETLAGYLYRNKNVEDAIKYYEDAAKIGKLKPETYYNIAIYYYGEQNIKKAVAHLEQAVKLKKDFTDARIALSAGYLSLGNYDKCIEQNNALLGKNKKDETAWYNNACAYAKKGNPKQALSSLQKAIEINPDNKKLAKNEKMFESLYKNAQFIRLTK